MKKWKLLGLACSLFVLAGCASLDSNIEVDNDFSGKWESQLQIPEPMSKVELESALQDSLQKEAKGSVPVGKLDDKETKEKIQKDQQALKEFADKHIKLEAVDPTGKEINDKDGTVRSGNWKITAKFDDDKELTKTYRIIYGALGSTPAENVIFPYGDESNEYMFYMGKSFGTTKITVDGDIKKEFETDGVVKDDTITFVKDKEIRFVFTTASHFFRNTIIAIIVIGGAIGGFIVWKRRGV